MKTGKQISFSVFFFVLVVQGISQIVYSESFNTSLAASGWTVTNLTVPFASGSFIGISNIWQVNDNESGMPPNSCGMANAGNFSLHMGATALISGAAYLSNARTNRRISSPNINTTGLTTLTLSFNFIGNGEANDDKAFFQYSTNGGLAWTSPVVVPTTANPSLGGGGSLNNLKSQICGGGQGLWTNVTWLLPVACENITNLKLAFTWINDNDASATDPSFAVDDIVITSPLVVLPLNWIDFNGKLNAENKSILSWKTANEKNNRSFEIQKSKDAINWEKIGTLKGINNESGLTDYTFIDEESLSTFSYYRIRQNDFNGKYSYSKLIELSPNDIGNAFELHVIPNPNSGNCVVKVNKVFTSSYKLRLINVLGQSSEIETKSNGEYQLALDLSQFAKGVYYLEVTCNEQKVVKKIILE